MKATERARWAITMCRAYDALRAAQAAIEALTPLASDEADMHVCFAGNTLRGSEALLRQADAVQCRPRRRGR